MRPTVSFLLRTPLVLLAVLVVAPTLHAQTVVGELVQAGTGRAVEGALVALLDEEGHTHRSVLTDAEGRFQLTAPAPGRYRLRADRIGHRSQLSPLFELAAGQRFVYRMAIEEQAITLEGVTAEAERQCRIRPEEGLAVARVWDEARKALAAAAWTEETELYRYDVVRYRRRLDPRRLRVIEETSRSRTGVGAHPFESRPPETLIRDGFVQETEDGTFYYAPDARVLLSDPFLDTHCFRIVESDDEETQGLVGLAFEPARGRHLPDIRGTFWLDPETAELTWLDYRYVHLDLPVRTDRLGGRVEFQHLPNGTWIVRRWWLRMPVIGVGGGYAWRGHRREATLVALEEEGGEVVRVVEPGGQAVDAVERAALSGFVFDSTDAAPLAGARVYLSGTEHAAVTDAGGRFRMDGLPEGSYAVAFWHARLDSLGIVAIPPRSVELRYGEETRVELAVPSLARIMASACPERDTMEVAPGTMPGDLTAVVAGVVRDSLTGTPVPGATVVLEWERWEAQKIHTTRPRIYEHPAQLKLTTNGQGRYLACAVPGAIPVRIRAAYLGRESGVVEFKAPENGVYQQDVQLDLSEPGSVAGRVTNHETGEPVAGATVRLGGAEGRRTVTDEDGRFHFAEVAPRRYAVQVSHVAYGTVADSVHVPSGRVADVQVRLAADAIPIAGVTVTVRSRREMEARARGMASRMLTRAEIEEVATGARHVGDVLRQLPGVIVREGGNAESPICVEAARRMQTARTARGCHMVAVYVDGVEVIADPGHYLSNLSPGEIEWIEFLPPDQAGLRYGTNAGQGVLLIHTRAGGGRR